MTSSIKEVCALFVQEYLHVKVGKSKFAKLRPSMHYSAVNFPTMCAFVNVTKISFLAVDALHKTCPNFPSYSHDLPETFLVSTSLQTLLGQ